MLAGGIILQGIRECIRLPVEGRGKQEETMRAVTVYRVDYDRKTRDPIGTVLEKRTTERAHNYHDLLRLARRLFAWDTADALHIIIDVSHVRGAIFPDRRGRFEETTSFRRLVAESR
jgi:hypothetical protein